MNSNANDNKLMNKFDSELEGVTPEKSAQIKSIFNPMVLMLEEIEQKYKQVITEFKTEIKADTTVKAKILRLSIAKVRVAAEKARKSEKEQHLRAGKAIDGFSNILKFAISEKEEKLKEIENYFTNIENDRILKLQNDREVELSKYADGDFSIYELGTMNTDVWSSFLSVKKRTCEVKAAAEATAEATAEAAAEAAAEAMLERMLKAEAEEMAVALVEDEDVNYEIKSMLSCERSAAKNAVSNSAESVKIRYEQLVGPEIAAKQGKSSSEKIEIKIEIYKDMYKKIESLAESKKITINEFLFTALRDVVKIENMLAECCNNEELPVIFSKEGLIRYR